MDIKTLKANVSAPLTSVQARAYRRIQAFKVITSYDFKRLVECIRLYEQSIECYKTTGKENDGLFGMVVEITSHRPTSTLTHVRQQTKVDSYIVIDDKPRKLEVKTNSGEMQDFYKLTSKERNVTYIHYVMDIDVRPSKYNPAGIRQIEFCCTLSHFLERCEEHKAIHDNGTNIRGAKCNLRADKKSLYKAFIEDLENGLVIPFDRRMTYCTEDFED